MAKYSDLLKNVTDHNLKEVYGIISNDAGETDIAHSVTMDSDIKAISHSMDSINRMREAMYRYQQSQLPSDHVSIDIDQFCKRVAKQAFNFVTMSYQAKQSAGVNDRGQKVVDSWYNSANGMGTTGDPGFYNTADIPIQMSPQQATAYYASGGIPKVIIDKKVNGPFINGYFFSGDFTEKQLDDFKKHYDRIGFLTAMKHGLRDALIYGGSAIIPHFISDARKVNYARDITSMGPMGKKEIDRFWTADRWNLVLVPNTDIEAADYFYPPYFYCPIAGVEINTQRMAIIRVNELPFWGAMIQIGWGISDMEGWMKSVLSYNIMMSSIPVMAQQISLVYQHIPADPIIFSNGPEMFQEWANKNSEQLALWSVNHPQTFNSYGEIKTLERTYTGYEELVKLLRENIGAESSIPESSIFHTQSQGFSDNTEDVTVKQSEAFKQISNVFVVQMQPLIHTMGLDFFGRGKEDKIGTLRLCLDSNTIITNDQKASIGMNFFNMLQIGIGAGIPADITGKIAGKFIAGIPISDEIIKMLEEGQAEADKKEEKDRKSQSQKTGLFGGSKPGAGKPGSSTPPKSSLSPGSKNDQKSAVRKSTGKGKS